MDGQGRGNLQQSAGSPVPESAAAEHLSFFLGGGGHLLIADISVLDEAFVEQLWF